MGEAHGEAATWAALACARSCRRLFAREARTNVLFKDGTCLQESAIGVGVSNYVIAVHNLDAHVQLDWRVRLGGRRRRRGGGGVVRDLLLCEKVVDAAEERGFDAHVLG